MTALGEVWRHSIPRDWRWTRLSYVATMGTGHTPDRTKPEYWRDVSIPWVTASDLSKRPSAYEPLHYTEQHVSELGVANSSAVVHPTGTVMLCRTASVGLFCQIGRPMATTQAFVTWTPKDELESRYLLYLIGAMRPEWDRLAYGSTHLTIYFPDLADVSIPVPPVEEQRRIANFLDDRVSRIDRIIAARREQVRAVDLAAKSELAAQAFDGDEHMPLRYLIVDERLGLWGSEQGEDEAEIRIARVADFERSEFRIGDVPTVRSAPRSQVKPRLLRHGDVLLERSGGTQINPVGCPAYVESPDDNTVCSNFVSRLRPQDEVDGRYLSLLLGALYATRQQAPHSTQTTGIMNLNTTSYFSVRVPVRSHSEQLSTGKQMDAALSNSRSRQAQLNRSMELLTEYKSSLITAAVTGEFDVSTAGPSIQG